jgi:hypothetical protein
MSDKTIIRTTKTIYPQIYAYVLPQYQPNEGWVKIGYTELQNVDARIHQQTHTAGITFEKLWSGPAKFYDSDEWFFDKHLHAYLRKFKEIEQRPNTEWFYYDGTPEQSHTHFEEFRHRRLSQVGEELEYRLRDEQMAAVEMTLSYIETHPRGEFLWNAKPRFGKTLTTYDLALRMDAQNVLIVTNRPAIANSWYDDFEDYIAWQTNYRFVSTADSLSERPVLTREQFIRLPNSSDGKFPRCIAFISLQDLKGSIHFGGTYNKLKWVKDLKWDLLVIDEAHEGVDTFKTDVAFTNITRNFTLHLSGTPFKAVASGRFSGDQIFNWTYADEQEAKSQWPLDSEENNPYESLPRLNLFSYQMSQMITDEVNKGAQIDGKDIDFAFDLNEFFATGENGKFLHEVEVRKWLDTLTQNEKYPFSTPKLRAELRHTFWLLNRVASAKALEKLLREHPVFENYEIVIAAGDGRAEEDEVIDENSFDRVKKAINDYEKTITLSVGQLTTGVTVRQWTAVLMLSNVKSPSLYMQAAFRAQNQWSFEFGGEKQCKQNAYVFDFAPERTLIIYDEFANNLSSRTVSGGGTTEDRENNILKLLNFFPVIAEDSDGKMIELDVRQVLTIPKTIKAQEVVRRGFMSNFLFQNISGIFASSEVREILDKLNPIDPGKVVPRKKEEPIDTKGVQVDAAGIATVDHSIVIAETDARFGEKVYADIRERAENALDDYPSSLPNAVASAFKHNVLEPIRQLARDNKVTLAQAELVVNQSANVIAREVEIVQKQADIRRAEAEVEYNREVAVAHNDSRAVEAAKARFEATEQEITEALQYKIASTIEEKTKELTQKSTEDILKKAEEKKRYSVEDDIRSRLRGFARTIPSFLMAYGESSTALSNFDQNIKDSVFKEVTGITLDQFRVLRDTYNFFDSVVFDESVQEFLRKKAELANYFDDDQDEDIFDYIPPQKTNQIFTPKKVVKLMIDRLEEEDPNLFKDKEKTFVDLYVKSGLYLTEIVKRLNIGLEEVIPEKNKRLEHIFQHQIYGFAPSEIIYNIVRKFVFGSFTDVGDTHVLCRDLTETAKIGGGLDMIFDVIVGNPPYQEDDGGAQKSARPIYQYFVKFAKNLKPEYITLIMPSRWYAGGKGLDDFRAEMLNDIHIKQIDDFLRPELVFPSTNNRGGVCCVLWSKHYDNIIDGVRVVSHESNNSVVVSNRSMKTRDLEIFIRNAESIKILDKVLPNNDIPVLSQYISPRKPFGLDGNFIKTHNFHEDKQSLKFPLKCYGKAKTVGYVEKSMVGTHPEWIDMWKVYFPYANNIGTELNDDNQNTFIGEPQSICTETFLLAGINLGLDISSATNLSNYMRTRFARFLHSLAKISQHGTARTYAFIPLQDFTLHSDIDWAQPIPEIDRQLYAKYGLDENEIIFIEKKIKPME